MKGITKTSLKFIIYLVIASVLTVGGLSLFTRVIDLFGMDTATQGFQKFLKPISEVCHGKETSFESDISIRSYDPNSYVNAIIQVYHIQDTDKYTVPLPMRKCMDANCLCLIRIKEGRNDWNCWSGYSAPGCPVWHFNKPDFATQIMGVMIDTIINWIIQKLAQYVAQKVIESVICGWACAQGAAICTLLCGAAMKVAVKAAIETMISEFLFKLMEPKSYFGYPQNIEILSIGTLSEDGTFTPEISTGDPTAYKREMAEKYLTWDTTSECITDMQLSLKVSSDEIAGDAISSFIDSLAAFVFSYGAAKIKFMKELDEYQKKLEEYNREAKNLYDSWAVSGAPQEQFDEALEGLQREYGINDISNNLQRDFGIELEGDVAGRFDLSEITEQAEKLARRAALARFAKAFGNKFAFSAYQIAMMKHVPGAPPELGGIIWGFHVFKGEVPVDYLESKCTLGDYMSGRIARDPVAMAGGKLLQEAMVSLELVPPFVFIDEDVLNFRKVDVVSCVTMEDLGCNKDDIVMATKSNNFFTMFRLVDPLFRSVKDIQKMTSCGLVGSQAGYNFNIPMMLKDYVIDYAKSGLTEALGEGAAEIISTILDVVLETLLWYYLPDAFRYLQGGFAECTTIGVRIYDPPLYGPFLYWVGYSDPISEFGYINTIPYIQAKRDDVGVVLSIEGVTG